MFRAVRKVIVFDMVVVVTANRNVSISARMNTEDENTNVMVKLM